MQENHDLQTPRHLSIKPRIFLITISLREMPHMPDLYYFIYTKNYRCSLIINKNCTPGMVHRQELELCWCSFWLYTTSAYLLVQRLCSFTHTKNCIVVLDWCTAKNWRCVGAHFDCTQLLHIYWSNGCAHFYIPRTVLQSWIGAPPRIGAVLVGWGCLVPMWGRSRMNFNAHTDTILFKIVG